MLSMSKHIARLTHRNTREETHGEEKIKAEDLKLRFRTAASILDDFEAGLRAAMFRPPELPKASNTGELFDGKDTAQLPPTVPRFETLPAFKLNIDMRGRLATIAYGIGDGMRFDCARARRFEVEIVKDATDLVDITYSLAVYPTPEQSGVLFSLIGRDVTVTIEPGSDTPPLTQASLIDDDAAQDDPEDDLARDEREERAELASIDGGDADDAFAGSDLAGGQIPGESQQ